MTTAPCLFWLTATMTARQVLRNTWLRRAFQAATGLPVEPTLRYYTVNRNTETIRPAHMPANEYVLYATGTYAFNTGYSVYFTQAFLVRDDAIVDCLHFNLAPPRKT